MSLLLDTILFWSAQVFVLVAVAACAAVTITHPKARLYFWQGILLLIVLIPLLEPWTPMPMDTSLITVEASQRIPQANAAGHTPIRSRWHREDWLLILAAGAGLRLLWIAAGFLRLRAYRRNATMLATPPLPFTGGAARWYASENLPGPVTYGWLHPSILLPARVMALPAALREPIACHELIHVNRRDWLFVLFEELLRSALWFHPAIWFVLGRIQLAREQVVDREVVRLTENRESYLEALVAVAEQSLSSDLAPAPLFLRKRQLAERVAEVLKEVSMSRSRIAANLAGVSSVTLMAALAAMWLFPFVSPAQTVADDAGVVVNPGAPLIHRTPIHQPAGTQMTGTVIVDATLNSKGEVTDTRVISGPIELRRTAIESVLQWHYAPGVSNAQASITFTGAATDAAAARGGVITGVMGGTGGGRSGGVGAGVGPGMGKSAAVPAPSGATGAPVPAFPATIKAMQFDGIGPEAEQQIRSRLSVREGGVIAQADLPNISQTVQDYDNHLRVSYMFAGADANGRTMGLNVQPDSAREVLLPPAFVTNGGPQVTIRVTPDSNAGMFVRVAPQTASAGTATRVPAAEQQAKRIKMAQPVYPALAKAARIQGAVHFDVIIGTDGTIGKVELLSGHPLLVEAAREALMQWVYQPSATPVETEVTINFTLQ